MKHTGNHKLLVGMFLSGLVLSATGEVKPLTEYHEASRMWMGVEEGFIRPASYEQFRLEADVQLVIHAKDHQVLEKGEHWATIDPEQLELEKRSAALEDARAVGKKRDAIQDAKDQHVRTIKDLHEAQAQKANISEILKNGDLDSMFEKRVKRAMEELEQQISMLEEQSSGDALKESIKLIEEDFSLQAAQRAKKLKVFEKNSKLVAKDGGKLQLGEDAKEQVAALSDPNQPIWVDANDLIASISDENAFEIIVAANGPLLSGIPNKELLVFFQDPQTGQLIEGTYVRTDERDSGRQIQRDFIFKASDKGIDAAKRASGASNTVHVYRKFDRPYRIVMKKDLVFENPEELERSGWVGMVQRLWPGSRVIQVAPQTIAIDPAK
jgi:hypothetical protein